MPDSFAALARGLADGNDIAADNLFDRYATRLVALARARLDPRLASRVDPEDVVQSALRSFLLACREGEVELHDPERLWRLLTVVTLRKCCRQAERHFAECRDTRRDAELDAAAHAPVPSREPTPEEAAMLAEAVQEAMGRLQTPLERRIFEMSLQGHGSAEIARELGYYERGVERTRAKIRQLLAEMAQS